jgi:hypothetical protein
MKRLLLAALLTLGCLSPVWASEEIGRQEDSANADGQVLMPIGCVRQDTIASSTSADGDYGNVKCNNVGRTYTSATIDAALPAGTNAIGKLSANGGVIIGDVNLVSAIPAGGNTIGGVNIVSDTPGTGATNLGKAEDNPHVSGDTGVQLLGVRHDTSTSGLGIDGDYASLGLNSLGELYTQSNTELPAASLLTNNMAVPTTPLIGAVMMCYDGTNVDLCLPGLSDTDDNSVAFSQITTIVIGETHVSDGVSWVRELAYLEDAASAGGEQLKLAGVVRQDTPAGSTSADGDYTYLKSDSIGRLWVNCGTGCSGGTQFAEDAAHVSGDVGTLALAKRTDAAAVSSGTDGDYSTLNVDASGRLWVNCGTGCSGTQYTEDVASAGAESLTLAGTVRRDAAASSAGTDGDYATLNTDALGRLWVNCGTGCSGGTQFAEDAASANGDVGTLAMARRTATPANTSGTDLDYETLQMANGRLWVSATIDAAIPAGGNTIGNVNPGTAANWGVYVEDAAETAGGNLMMAGTVRRDTQATSSNASGDNSTLNTDSLGNLWITGTVIEDAAETAGGQLLMAGSVRRDTLASSAGTSGDNATFNTNSLGALFTQATAGPSGGATPKYLTSAASTNSTSVKATAGTLYTVSAVNTTGTLYYLRLYNSTAAPTCSSATDFVETIPVPASTTGAGYVRDISVGEAFSQGIGFCLTGGGSSTDNTNAATGVYLTLLYN